jgi:hypothetical protein
MEYVNLGVGLAHANGGLVEWGPGWALGEVVVSSHLELDLMRWAFHRADDGPMLAVRQDGAAPMADGRTGRRFEFLWVDRGVSEARPALEDFLRRGGNVLRPSSTGYGSDAVRPSIPEDDDQDSWMALSMSLLFVTAPLFKTAGSG